MEHNPRKMAALLRHRTDQNLTWGPWWPVTFDEWHRWMRGPEKVAEAAGFYLFCQKGVTESGRTWEKWWVVRSRGWREGFSRAWVKMDDKLREAFGITQETE